MNNKRKNSTSQTTENQRSACREGGGCIPFSTSITCRLQTEDAPFEEMGGKAAAMPQQSQAGRPSKPFAVVLPLDAARPSFFRRRQAACGLTWTRAEPGRSAAEQAGLLSEGEHAAQDAYQDAFLTEGFDEEGKAAALADYSGSKGPGESGRTRFDSGIIAEDRAGFLRLKPLQHRFGPVCSLAALLLSVKSQGIEVWELPASCTKRHSTCWWVWAARLGRLSARADKVFGSLEEAMRLADGLKESLGIEEVSIVYASGVQEELAALDRLPAREFAKARLQPLRMLSTWPVRLAFAAALITALLAVAYAAAPELLPFSSAEKAKLSRLSAADQKACDIRAHPERYFPSGWLKEPSPHDAVLHIMPRLLETPLAANGWTLDSLTATDKDITTTWKATAAASLLLPPKGAALQAKEATLASAIQPLSGERNHAQRKWQDIAGQKEITAVLAELTSRFKLNMQLSWKKAQTIRVDEEAVSCPWIVGHLTLSQMPGSLFADFPSLALALSDSKTAGSMVLSSISWKDRHWTMTGEIYAKP